MNHLKMVTNMMENNHLPIPPPLMSHPCSKGSQRSTNSKGFRLCDEQLETGSIYSIYKQKIDSMFESDSSGAVNNTVQDRIEHMFTEVAHDEGIRTEPDQGCHTFSIDYLGSIPLVTKVTSLSGLQVPLKDLYFAYKRTKHHNTLTGRLEISTLGLKVQYQGDKGDLEQLNPFPTIAVWSAVKFVLHNSPRKSYAFLPLITDPDNIDKQSLFKDLDDSEVKYITDQFHAPLFAVVMRKIGLHKQLECHGFVCQTSEDAIVIAATLYKSLMGFMKSKNKKPRNRNGVSCMSVTSSICTDSIQNATPVRPPRKKRSSASSLVSDTEISKQDESTKPVKKSTKSRRAPTVPLPKYQQDLDEILPYEEPTEVSKNSRSWNSPAKNWENPLKRDKSIKHKSGKSDSSQESRKSQEDSTDLVPYEDLENLSKSPSKSSGNLSRGNIRRNDKSEQDDTNQELIQNGSKQQLTQQGEGKEEFMSEEDVQQRLLSENVSRRSEGKDKQSAKSEGCELKRTRSVRRTDDSILSKTGDISGDIFTKVTIPRSGSFLNAGGLTRYKSKVNRANGQTSGGSPLGFHELFNEFRLQEGLHSMDEILGVIIDSEGMSFNDLKPIYKEFLLKLAVTLTKDELYQRSKSIMRRQKKKLLRKNSNTFPKHRRKNIIIGAKLKRVFRKSFRSNLLKRMRRMKLNDRESENTCEEVDQETPSPRKQKEVDHLRHQGQESSISSSSYDTRQFRPKQSSKQHSNKQINKGAAKSAHKNKQQSKEQTNVNKSNKVATKQTTNMVRRQSYRKRNSDIKEANMRIRRERMSTSEDSDFFTMKRTKMKTSPSNQNRNSSSGYVSCSECSYDSDTCTCISADKCYCSLGNKFDRVRQSSKTTNYHSEDQCSCAEDQCSKDTCSQYQCTKENCSQEKYNCPLDKHSFSFCGCDTDSCTDSNKCYCQNFVPKGTIFQQLQRRGFIPTSETMETPPNQRKLCKKDSNTRSTKSVEYYHNPTEKYYDKIAGSRRSLEEHQTKRSDSKKGRERRAYSSDNLAVAVDYDLLHDEEKKSNSVYGRAMSEVAPRSFHMQNSVRSFKSFSGNQRRASGKTLKATVPATSSTEALSVKKSAEIAALFADIKLSQTTDITHLTNVPATIHNSHQYPSHQFENSSYPPTDFEISKHLPVSTSINSNFCQQFHGFKPGSRAAKSENKKAIVTPYKHISNSNTKTGQYGSKMVHNSLYAVRNLNGGRDGGLYSARNGLYTIQSQSDSSCSENKNDGRLKKGVGSLENTLGYLP